MATHKNRNPLWNATLAGVDKARIEAGTRRDGTALARCDALIAVVAEINQAMDDMDMPQDLPRRADVSALSRRLRETALFSAIHDQFARGEIDPAAYGAALDGARAGVAKLHLG